MRAGYDIWWPITQNGRADFAVSKDGSDFLKVQVKKAGKRRRTLLVRTVANRGGNRGAYRYQAGDFDLFAAVSPNGDRVWVIPFAALPGTVQIRLDTPNMDQWLQQ